MTGRIEQEDGAGDFWNTLRVIFLERLSSPLISTFIISWCVSNYKVILILLADAPLKEKTTELNDYFHGPFWLVWPHSWLWIIGAPAVATAFYIFVYPEINIRVMRIVNKNDNKLKTQQELNQYKRVVDKLEAEIILKDTTIADLKARVADAESIVNEKMNELASLQVVFDEYKTKDRLQIRHEQAEQAIIDALYPFWVEDRFVSLNTLIKQIMKKGFYEEDIQAALASLTVQFLIKTNMVDEEKVVSIDGSRIEVLQTRYRFPRNS